MKKLEQEKEKGRRRKGKFERIIRKTGSKRNTVAYKKEGREQDMSTGEFFLCIIIAAGLGVIPAYLAKQKGYDPGLWWVYGFLLFIVAIIHVIIIPDKNTQHFIAQQTPINTQQTNLSSSSSLSGLNAAEELKKYKELMDQGIITETEYNVQKDKLLRKI